MIGEQLKILRKKRNLKAFHVAKLTGISKSYISEIEKGHKNVSIEVLFKLCFILKCRPSKFINEAFKEWKKETELEIVVTREHRLNKKRSNIGME